MEHEGDGDINCNFRARYSQEMIGTGTERLGNKKTSGDHLTTALLRSARIPRSVQEN